MNSLVNTTIQESEFYNSFYRFNNSTANSVLPGSHNKNFIPTEYNYTENSGLDLLSTNANLQMLNGQIPDLRKVCRDLFGTFSQNQFPYSAKQFTSVLRNFQEIDQEQIKRFLRNRDTRHVLVDNKLLKVVLIHWKPGKVSSIHGHPAGGCTFKILQGKVEELRYSTDGSQRIIDSNCYRAGDIAYIDNTMGFHAVGNIFGSSAVSLHAYTPGK